MEYTPLRPEPNDGPLGIASAGSTGEAPSEAAMAALLAPQGGTGSSSATLRDRIRDLLEQPDSTVAARVVNYVLMFTILVSTASVALETMPEFRGDLAFFLLEMVITAFFTVELLLRLYVCESFRTFALNGFNLIDFFAIFPGYMELLCMLAYESRSSANSETLVHKAASSMRTLRVVRMGRLLRVMRVMRLAKAARHSPSLGIVLAVITRVSTTALAVTFMLLGVATVLSASLAYISESELCDDKASGCSGAFDSIPAAFWWAVATLTTVGYGDMIPRTTVGKVISGLTAVIGVVVVAIGVALVSRNFSECYIEEKARAEVRGRLVAQCPESRLQEILDINEQREVFEQKSAALVLKLRSMAMQQDNMVHLAPMLDMIAFHSTEFSSDVQLYANTFLSPDATQNSVRSNQE
mmetsp:Transcript_146838/g.256206  ORF Transcript_146838/g.256206 Transcript_146838/m.256206 type:complete len:412 (-) Transcript_146838:51-1286(-)